MLAAQGTLTRGTGVYDEWGEFSTALTGANGVVGVISLRESGILIADMRKGVLNGNQTNGTVLLSVSLSEDWAQLNPTMQIFAVLVASGMHDGSYQVHGQARLESVSTFRPREGIED